jgi:hypothetical protein
MIDDRAREAIWIAFSDQFLDGEERDSIPHAALACVEAGCSVTEARDIWRHEVTPAVGFNLHSVAGEWGGWNRDWLLARVAARRSRGQNRLPGPVRYVAYRLRAGVAHSSWTAIERCMRLLEATDPARRPSVSSDLALLARVYFDDDLDHRHRELAAGLSPERRRNLSLLFESAFLSIFRPLVVRWSTHESPRECARRVETFLSPRS